MPRVGTGLVCALAAALLALVVLLVVADPTPSFLGFAPDDDATDAATPVGNAPGQADYTPPLVSKPPEASAADRCAVAHAPAPLAGATRPAPTPLLLARAPSAAAALAAARAGTTPLRC